MEKTLLVEIEPSVVERFPGILIGGFLVHGLEGLSDCFPVDIFRSSRPFLEDQGLTIQRLSEDPRIRDWREAISKCGLKPSTFKSSPEQLARRLLKGSSVSTPFPVVNAYCAVSVRHLAPMGGYDLDRLPQPTIALRHPHLERDHFSPLGAPSEEMQLNSDVVIYASGHEVICWAFNHRDSKMTSIQADTQSAVFISEAVSESQVMATRAALEELASLLKGAGAQVGQIEYIDQSLPRMRLTLSTSKAAAGNSDSVISHHRTDVLNKD